MGRITLDKVTKSFGEVNVIPPLDLTIMLKSWMTTMTTNTIRRIVVTAGFSSSLE